jgi:hypothetical protein
MTNERFDRIAALCAQFNNLPDGAFLAVLEEHGVDANDLMEHTEEEARRKQAKESKERKS